MSPSHPSSAIGPGGTLSPQVARFKAAHYVVNYLELAEIVVEVVYDLLAERRAYTFTSGDLVRDAFNITETDILERWADVELTTLDLMTPENADTLGNAPKIWPALFHFLYYSLGDVDLTGAFLRWIHTAMSNALEDADFPPLYQFQLNLLEQWYLMPHEGDSGITFDQLMMLLNAVAAFRGIVDEVLNFSFEDLKFTEKFSGNVSLKVDGVVNIVLPEDAADFLSWDLDGETYRITLHFDEIAMADDSEFALIVDNPITELRFPFGGSLNALRFFGVDVNLVVDPEHGPARPAEFAPYHQFSDAYFSSRPGESLAELDIDVDDVSFSLGNTVITTLLSAAAAYIDLWTNDDIGDLGAALGEAAADAVRDLDDIGGLAGKMAGALGAVFPNALACAIHDIHRPFLSGHTALPYDRIRAEAENGALIVFNEGPLVSQPDDEPVGGSTRFPDDIDIYWPGILDELGPGPDSGGGGGRASRLLDPIRLDTVRIPAAHRAEYERRLAAAGPVPPEQTAAARLLIDGLDLRTVRLLNERQIDRAAGKVAGVPVSRPTMAALARLTPAGKVGAGFLFSANGQLASPTAMFAQAFTPLMPTMTSDRLVPVYPSSYAPESTLAARRGLAVDPGWLGLSVNSYAVDAVLRVVAASELIAATGEAAAPARSAGPLPGGGELLTFQYATAATDSFRLFADLTGNQSALPVAELRGLEVTLSRQGAEARYRVDGRIPLAAVRTASGCLPDSALLVVVQNASCIARLTGGAIDDADYRDELLYRHFVFLEPIEEVVVVTEFALLEGDPDRLARGGFEPRLLLAAALRGVWAQIGRVPMLFDPFYALSPTVDSFEAKDGWLNVYERYAMG